MNRRYPVRIVVCWVAVASLGMGSFRARADEPAQAHAEDEKAIRAVDAQFVNHYNIGNGKALAALFTEDAEVIEADGAHYQGRTLVEKSFVDTFEANKGAKIEFRIDAIRFLSPDVAKEDGRSVVTPTKGEAVSRLYTVLFVKRESRWLISSVREEFDPSVIVRPHDRLKDLEWLIGDWVEERSDAHVRVLCRWSDDQNFLVRTVTVQHQGKSISTITQRIGWDALAARIRSWDFDSDGGFGGGTWSREGERWVVKYTNVQPDGTPGSATNILTRVRPDLVRWVSTARVLGERSIPGEEHYALVRVPPKPRLNAATAPNASPSTQPARTPR